MIRFQTNRMWHGERVYQHDPVEGTQQEKADLLSCGQAYEDEPVLPTIQNTKKEIEAYLDANDIPYDEYATKAELLECLPSD